MSKKKKWLMGMSASLCLVVTTLVILYLISRWPLPSLNSVASVKAIVYVRSDRKEFDIAPEVWPELWANLEPADIDLFPSKWVVMGSLQITLKNSNTISVAIFSLSNEPGAFKIGSWYYRGGNSNNVDKIIKNAYQASLTSKP